MGPRRQAARSLRRHLPERGSTRLGHRRLVHAAARRLRGAGELYGYVLPAHAYGTELGLGAWSFTTGEWHHVVEETVLNTNGAPNGAVRVWYDTDPIRSPTFETTNLTYRTDATPVSRIFFSTFFGGHDASWATPTDTSIEFAEFVVCR